MQDVTSFLFYIHIMFTKYIKYFPIYYTCNLYTYLYTFYKIHKHTSPAVLNWICISILYISQFHTHDTSQTKTEFSLDFKLHSWHYIECVPYIPTPNLYNVHTLGICMVCCTDIGNANTNLIFIFVYFCILLYKSNLSRAKCLQENKNKIKWWVI